MSSNDETNRDPNLDDEARSDTSEDGEGSKLSESEAPSALSTPSASEAEEGASTSGSSASRPMSPGARLAAQKAAKAVLKSQKKEERKATAAPEEGEEEIPAEEPEAAPELAPLEQTDLGRATLRAGDWWAANSQLAIGALVAVGVGVAGYVGYRVYAENKAEAAGSLLEQAVEAANAPIEAESDSSDTAADDEGLTFATAEARDEAALTAYQRVIAEHGDTDAAAYARLGAARALVSLGRAEEARPLYEQAAEAGGANGMIGLEALEGLGAIQEGAGDLDGAQATYERLGLLADHRFEPVSKYHLARLQIARGNDDEARTALRELVADLRTEGANAPEPAFPYVLAQAEMRLRELDPSTASAAPSFGAGSAGAEMDPQIQEMIRRMQAEAAAGGAGGGE